MWVVWLLMTKRASCYQNQYFLLYKILISSQGDGELHGKLGNRCAWKSGPAWGKAPRILSKVSFDPALSRRWAGDLPRPLAASVIQCYCVNFQMCDYVTKDGCVLSLNKQSYAPVIGRIKHENYHKNQLLHWDSIKSPYTVTMIMF